MALQDDSVGISVTIRDLAKDESTKVYPTNLTVADGLAALEAARDALIAELDPITDGLIYKVGMVLSQTEDTAIVGAGDTKDKAIISCNLATAGKKANLFVPCPAIGIFQDTSGPSVNVVDGTNADVLAFLALFATGGDFTLSDGEQLNATTPFSYGKRN